MLLWCDKRNRFQTALTVSVFFLSDSWDPLWQHFTVYYTKLVDILIQRDHTLLNNRCNVGVTCLALGYLNNRSRCRKTLFIYFHVLPVDLWSHFPHRQDTACMGYTVYRFFLLQIPFHLHIDSYLLGEAASTCLHRNECVWSPQPPKQVS